MDNGFSAEHTVQIKASPARVYRYLTDAQLIKTWHGVDVTLDARPGGAYRNNVTGRDIAAGVFLDLSPYDRVAYSFGWEGSSAIPPGSSTVTFQLTQEGNATIVDLRHDGLPDAEAAKQHSEGWMHYLERLSIAASGGDPGPDPWDLTHIT